MKENFQTIENVFHPSYEKFSKKVRTRVGTKKVLQWLDANNIKKIIYSNHNVPSIDKHLNRLNINNFFHKVLARGLNDNSQVHFRSKDLKLSDYVIKYKIKPAEVISIGDSEEEIEIGKKYGYHTVALTGGWNSTTRLKKHKPDFLIHNLKDLIGIVKQLNRTGFLRLRRTGMT